MGLISGACANERVRPIRTTINGNLQVQISPPTRIYKHKVLAGIAETTVWAGVVTGTIVISDIIVSNTNGGTCTFRDGTAGIDVMILNVAANTPLSINLITPLELSAISRNFTAQASAATWYITVLGWIKGFEP